MRSLKSLLRLPTPVEAGWSDQNALGSEHFGLQPGQRSWEQFDAYLKANYPIRAFISITLRNAILDVWYPIRRPFVDAHYWLVSHLVPSRRYHMLDLRQPSYTHGWIDCDTRIEYALFNILNVFVEKEMPHKYLPSEEDIEKEGEEYGTKEQLRDQRERCLEVLRIHAWWNVERVAMEKAIEDKITEMYGTRPFSHNDDDVKVLSAMEEALENTKTEMMHRLIMIRHTLWT